MAARDRPSKTLTTTNSARRARSPAAGLRFILTHNGIPDRALVDVAPRDAAKLIREHTARVADDSEHREYYAALAANDVTTLSDD
jgi:hypothetical protein